jgi:hypothetical protein
METGKVIGETVEGTPVIAETIETESNEVISVKIKK